GQRYDTLRRASASDDFAISLFPIAALVAKLKIADMAPRSLDTEIFPEPRARQTHAQLKRLGSEYIEKAQRRKQRLKLRRLNVGTNRKVGLGALRAPIVEQFLLFGNDELGSNGLILRCQVRLLK